MSTCVEWTLINASKVIYDRFSLTWHDKTLSTSARSKEQKSYLRTALVGITAYDTLSFKRKEHGAEEFAGRSSYMRCVASVNILEAVTYVQRAALVGITANDTLRFTRKEHSAGDFASRSKARQGKDVCDLPQLSFSTPLLARAVDSYVFPLAT